MEVKNLLDPAARIEIIARINKLSPQSQAQWGKMNVSQMLAHLQMPLGVALGTHKLKRTLAGMIFGPIAKPMLYNSKPTRKNLPTDKSFVMTGTEKDFEVEKNKLIAMIDNFSESNIVDEPHPFFGKLNKVQWSKGMWKHIDHHLEQFGV